MSTGVRTAVGQVDALALAPVREALLARAHADADAGVARAEAEAAGVVARAEEQARATLREAREQGASDAATVAALAEARTRRQARALVLAAQRRAYEALLEACRTALRELVAGPEGAPVREGLAAAVRAAVGADAVLTSTPDGFAAQSGGRRAEISWDALATAMVADLGEEASASWLP